MNTNLRLQNTRPERLVGSENRRALATAACVLAASAILLAGCASSEVFNANGFEKSIITQKEWGGIPADSGKVQQIHWITLHHEGELFPPGKDPVEYLRTLQKWSRATKHWSDIPYHYVIDLGGKVYEGRPIQYAGDTNTDYDPTGHALVCVVGNFEEVEPNQQQLQAVVKTFTWLCLKYGLTPDKIRGHKDWASGTVCPGKNLYRYLDNGYFRNEVARMLRTAER